VELALGVVLRDRCSPQLPRDEQEDDDPEIAGPCERCDPTGLSTRGAYRPRSFCTLRLRFRAWLRLNRDSDWQRRVELRLVDGRRRSLSHEMSRPLITQGNGGLNGRRVWLASNW